VAGREFFLRLLGVRGAGVFQRGGSANFTRGGMGVWHVSEVSINASQFSCSLLTLEGGRLSVI